MGLGRGQPPRHPQMGLGSAQGLPARRPKNQPQPGAPGGSTYVAPWETDPLSQDAFAQANKTYGNTIGYIGSNRESLERHFGY